ncbi:MAG: hypothetical protein IPK26_27780 [Planctomycetes bacterium]|nr:hypothetical protein [Planctomycetota bacterium]
MNPRLPQRLAAGLVLAQALALLPAQENAPPWWGVADNNTVSLAWDFEGPAPLQPSFVRAPAWYNPTVTALVPSPGIQVLGGVAGHGQVLALAGNGTPRSESIALKVDNDPRPYWIKEFWVQFEANESATGSIRAKLREALNSPNNAYKRADIVESEESLGGGWARVTIEANLIPQPWDEDIDWTLIESALGTDMIDNLFVNSRCVAPPPDETGDALGLVESSTVIDLAVATGNANCFAACAFTTGAGTRRYFVSAQSPAANQQLLIFEVQGPTAAIPITTPIQPSPLPVSLHDLALADIPGRGTLIFGVADERGTVGVGTVTLKALNPNVVPAVFLPGADIVLQNFPAGLQPPFGLAFNPDGAQGAGTFWITERTGVAIEYRVNGTPTGELITTGEGMPLGVVGAGYDRFTGMLYWWSQRPTPGPVGPVQVCGFEHSLYTQRPTGVEFFGDLTLAGAPAGGIATGMEVYRRAGDDLRLLVVANVGGRSVMYEMKGPFRYGWSLEGRIGMEGGAPFRGNANWGLTLRGVPDASFAMLFLGFDNRNYAGQQLPVYLSTLGLAETAISVALDLQATLRPIVNGGTREPVPIPALAGLQGVPMFSQWLILDPTVPQGLTMSQAGKTIIW